MKSRINLVGALQVRWLASVYSGGKEGAKARWTDRYLETVLYNIYIYGREVHLKMLGYRIYRFKRKEKRRE